MEVINSYFPAWRTSLIHETSPVFRGASRRLAAECEGYLPSQYFPETPPGTEINGVRSENLESLSFPDESIDLHISQDVIEHIFDPSRAFVEIARTLRPGGMHIFTVPLVNKFQPSKRRAKMQGGQVIYVAPPQYHGNPVGDGNALVTVDWGFDICEHIFDACGLFTHVVKIDDLSRGIRAEYIEVLVTVKPRSSNDQ